MNPEEALSTFQQKMIYQRDHGPLPLINDQKKLIMFWMPRCGCTTSMYWFFGTLGLHDILDTLYPELGIDVGAKVHRYRGEIWEKEYYGEKMISQILETITNPDYFKFVVIRNPYSRLVSTYFGLMNNRELFRMIFPAMEDNISFSQFIEILQSVNCYDCEMHLRYQTSSVCWSDECKLDSIIEIEHLDEGLNQINATLSMKIPLKTLWSSRTFYPRTEEYFNDLKFEDLKVAIKGRGRPHYKSFYTSGIKEKVYELLQVDIDGLGYTFDGKADRTT